MSSIISYCLKSENWVKFRLNIGTYQNFLTFLYEHEISFLAEMKLDFTTIPLIYHGKGYSYNLLQYLANNVDNNELIINFLNYFITNIVKFKYYDGVPFAFIFSEASDWQNSNLEIYNIPITTTTTTFVPTTTTTTTTFVTTTTTTTSIYNPESFELFGQFFNI